MEQHAEGLVTALAETDEITVYSPADKARADPGPFKQKTILSGNLAVDGKRLAGENVDAWFALNVGFVPLVARVDLPFLRTFTVQIC